MSLLMDYGWPGNVRELQSAVRFAVIKSRGEMIGPEDLPVEIRNRRKTPVPGPAKKLDMERVNAALRESGGNRSRAAKVLGVGRATLYRFLVDFPDVS